MNKAEIRNAATVILYRCAEAPEVLMGQRGARAAFMPNKFVFPGGAVDAQDAQIPLAGMPDPACLSRLAENTDAALVPGLIAAAVRETWEETGLVLGSPGAWVDPPEDWDGFARTGHRPDGTGLRFIFRAITPPGRPRRFDARFFLAPASLVAGDPDDFSQASDELSALQWVPLAEARNYNLPFITEVVLAEVAHLIKEDGPPASVPFFCNDDEESLFLRLKGRAPDVARE